MINGEIAPPYWQIEEEQDYKVSHFMRMPPKPKPKTAKHIHGLLKKAWSEIKENSEIEKA